MKNENPCTGNADFGFVYDAIKTFKMAMENEVHDIISKQNTFIQMRSNCPKKLYSRIRTLQNRARRCDMAIGVLLKIYRCRISRKETQEEYINRRAKEKVKFDKKYMQRPIEECNNTLHDVFAD